MSSRYGSPAPLRSRQSTASLIGAGAVHLLRRNGVAAGAFTLTPQAPFAARWAEQVFPPARQPIYLMRLAVRPELQTGGSLVGVRVLRKAIEVAADGGADALRSETNPDLTATLRMLLAVGFTQYGPVLTGQDGRRRVYLQRELAGPEASDPG